MNKLNLDGLRRLVLDLLCGDPAGIQFFSDKSKVFAPHYVYEARSLADQQGFGERKINVRKSIFQLH